MIFWGRGDRVEPPPERRQLRRIPRVLGSSFRLVWEAAPGRFLASLAPQIVRARWEEAERELPRMDRLGEKGAAFASALATAIREEIASARGGSKPQHAALRKLGYNGVSELLSYRVK